MISNITANIVSTPDLKANKIEISFANFDFRTGIKFNVRFYGQYGPVDHRFVDIPVSDWQEWTSTQSETNDSNYIKYKILTTLGLQEDFGDNPPDSNIENAVDTTAIWYQKLQEGFTDPVTNVKLKTTVDAQRWFTSMAISVREAIDLGAITNDTQQVIWDFNEQPQTLTTLEIRQVLLRYAAYCQEIFNLYKP
jgi:hypothetical protein